jgi:hypothetical protein
VIQSLAAQPSLAGCANLSVSLALQRSHCHLSNSRSHDIWPWCLPAITILKLLFWDVALTRNLSLTTGRPHAKVPSRSYSTYVSSSGLVALQRALWRKINLYVHNINASKWQQLQHLRVLPNRHYKIQCQWRLSFGVLVPAFRDVLHDSVDKNFQGFRLLSNALRSASAQVLHQ